MTSSYSSRAVGSESLSRAEYAPLRIMTGLPAHNPLTHFFIPT